MHRRAATVLLTSLLLPITPVHADDLRAFTSKGLRGSRGVVVTFSHPPGWKRTDSDDPLALAELRGAHGPLTAVVQVARGLRRPGVPPACEPERAPTMLQGLEPDEADTRITDVVARDFDGRRGYEIRYERRQPPESLLVRSAVVCLKDSRLLVSCGAAGDNKAALAEIEPVCRRVLDSLRVVED